MTYESERLALVCYGQKMVQNNLVKGAGGNLSIYLRDDQKMLITPSGIDYLSMQANDIVVMDLDGNIFEGGKPSTEHHMHRAVYRHRKDINAICHCHSVYSATLATLRWNIPAAYYLIAVAGGNDVRVAEYARYGSNELADNVLKAMEGRTAALMANHGLIAGAKDIANAFAKAEEVELCAEVYYRAKAVGNPILLTEQEVSETLDGFKTYGQITTKNNQ